MIKLFGEFHRCGCESGSLGKPSTGDAQQHNRTEDGDPGTGQMMVIKGPLRLEVGKPFPKNSLVPRIASPPLAIRPLVVADARQTVNSFSSSLLSNQRCFYGLTVWIESFPSDIATPSVRRVHPSITPATHSLIRGRLAPCGYYEISTTSSFRIIRRCPIQD